MADRRAIVIGGGIGGLSAALQLRRVGFEVSVFEAQNGLSEVDTGLSLWAFAVRRLEELGFAGELAAIGAPIERVVHRDPDGAPLGEVDIRALNDRVGSPSYEVHRSKLQHLLADRLGARSIHFGRRCSSVRSQGPVAEAVFEDGEVEAADVLVGADGVHSVVRGAVCPGVQLRRSRVSVWRGITPVGAKTPRVGTHVRFMGPARLFGVARISENLARWYAGARPAESRPRTQEEIKRLAFEHFRGWPALVEDTLKETREEDYLFNDTPNAPPLRTWGRSRITLLGDAGHASMPTLGISAGLAIEDASVLADCLRCSVDEFAGLRAYERERRRVTGRVVRAAALFGRVLMIERQPLYSLRQLGVKWAPQEAAMTWLVRGAR